MAWWLLPICLYGVKKIYDAVTDDEEDDVEYVKVKKGPSKAQIRKKQRDAVYNELKKEICTLWKNTDLLLCLQDSESISHCEGLLNAVKRGEVSPDDACESLRAREIKKSKVLKTKVKISAPQNFFRGTLNDTASLIRRINTSLDAGFSPRMALGDHYELCRDEYRLAMLRAAFATHKSGGLASLSDDCARDHADLAALWHKARLLEAAQNEGTEMRVVVCGMLKAGKSSLLNSLFDDKADTLFKVGTTRTTTKNQVRVKDGVRFIDTPGLEANTEDTQEAREAYQSADMLLFVHSGERELVAPELTLLHTLHNEYDKLKEHLVVVISHIDQTGEALERLQSKMNEQLAKIIGESVPIFAISNKRYKKSFECGKEAFRKTSGIDDLREHILGQRDTRVLFLSERKNKLANVYEDIKCWIAAFGQNVEERRNNLSSAQNNIFINFNENVLSSIRAQLKNIN